MTNNTWHDTVILCIPAVYYFLYVSRLFNNLLKMSHIMEIMLSNNNMCLLDVNSPQIRNIHHLLLLLASFALHYFSKKCVLNAVLKISPL